MGIISTALVLANEEAAAEAGGVSPYLFGAFTFVALGVLLVVTMMIKVGD
jgi:hypothetical protein